MIEDVTLTRIVGIGTFLVSLGVIYFVYEKWLDKWLDKKIEYYASKQLMLWDPVQIRGESYTHDVLIISGLFGIMIGWYILLPESINIMGLVWALPLIGKLRLTWMKIRKKN